MIWSRDHGVKTKVIIFSWKEQGNFYFTQGKRNNSWSSFLLVESPFLRETIQEFSKLVGSSRVRQVLIQSVSRLRLSHNGESMAQLDEISRVKGRFQALITYVMFKKNTRACTYHTLQTGIYYCEWVSREEVQALSRGYVCVLSLNFRVLRRKLACVALFFPAATTSKRLLRRLGGGHVCVGILLL